mmetsp:Transcript_32791/g.63259  ORF Transcript_32791/g.63259 Transcript_32791/m.63259 type:complete len:111 (+) Transcript_32791:199-531(+)
MLLRSFRTSETLKPSASSLPDRVSEVDAVEKSKHPDISMAIPPKVLMVRKHTSPKAKPQKAAAVRRSESPDICDVCIGFPGICLTSSKTLFATETIPMVSEARNTTTFLP